MRPHPKSKMRGAKGGKDRERLQTIKLTRDCAVAAGELLVLMMLAMLLGRMGMCVVWGLDWVRWVFGWGAWLFTGLFWG